MDGYGRFRVEQRTEKGVRRRISTCVLSVFGEEADAPEIFRVAFAVTDDPARRRGVDPVALAIERATARLKQLVDGGAPPRGVCYRTTEGVSAARYDVVPMDEHLRRPMPHLG